MKKRDRSLSEELTGLDTPDHRPGFWGSVEAELKRVSAGDDVRGNGPEPELVPLGQGHRRRRRTSPWIAAAVAAALVLVMGAGMALLFSPDDGEVTATETSLVEGLPERGGESLSGVAAADDAEEAPWQAPALRLADVPSVLIDEWQSAENRRWCPAVALALGASGVDAEPRAADFGGGWAVAWDLTGGPGQNADGTDCEDCGRSAFGIAGVGMVAGPDTGARHESRTSWTDGSRASRGAESSDAGARKLLAEIAITSSGCVYQVWSHLGDDHLVGLINSLRFVDGLDSGPVALRAPGDQQRVQQKGDPPWAADPVAEDTVDALVIEQWNALQTGAPRLVIADLGDVAGAEVRTWGQGVAWDNPDGPGHTGLNEPCVDCGRGVVGIGWRDSAEPAPNLVSPPYRVEWSDGSFAEYGGRLTDNALPRDLVIYNDPETGEPTLDALLATVHLEGHDGEVVIWTHLGEQHLLELLDQLRLFE